MTTIRTLLKTYDKDITLIKYINSHKLILNYASQELHKVSELYADKEVKQINSSTFILM